MAMAGFSSSKNGSFFIRGKSIDDNLYLYHVVLTTKAKDRRSRGFRRSAKEKLSYTAERNVLRCVLPRDPKHLAFLPNSNCFVRLRKNRQPVSVGNVIVYAFPTNKKPSILTGKARHRHEISGLPQEHEGM